LPEDIQKYFLFGIFEENGQLASAQQDMNDIHARLHGYTPSPAVHRPLQCLEQKRFGTNSLSAIGVMNLLKTHSRNKQSSDVDVLNES
jgi:hypothetical protein